MGFFIPGLGVGGGGGAPGTVTTVNGKPADGQGNILITAEDLGAVNNIVQTPNEIKLQSGGNDIGHIEVIEELNIDALINRLV